MRYLAGLIRIARTVLALLVELAGFGLIIYAGMLLATWLGFALAGAIALGVAVWLSPPESGPGTGQDEP